MKDGLLQNADGVGFVRDYADVVANKPQILPEVDIPIRELRFSKGKMFFVFS